MRQARGDRLFPGEGALDLRGLLDALPPELPMSLEVPHAGGNAPTTFGAGFLSIVSPSPGFIGASVAVIGRDNIDGRYVGFRSRNSSARKQSRDGINRYVQGPS